MNRSLLFFLSLGIVSGISLSCSSSDASDVAVYKVKRGDFFDKIIVSGELEAVSSRVISTPALSWSMGFPKVAKIVDDGKRVEKDELLVQFDPSEVEKTITDARNELEIANAELAKARVNHESQLEELKADLQMAEISYRISKLKLEQSSFEADIDRKKIELDLEKAGISLEQARQEIENRRKVQREELSKLELKVQQAQTKLDQAQDTLKSLTITAPTLGIAIIKDSWMTGLKIQVNDQVYPGMPLIGLPDLSAMKAVVLVNEVDIARIEKGKAAVVKLDAFPETSFSGKVTEIATLARNKKENSNVKVFDTTILLDGVTEKMMPGMTVNSEIIIDKIPDTLFIPLEALFIKENKPLVYLRKSSKFEPCDVVIGPESTDYVIIEKGLKEGDEVALVDPTVKPAALGEKKTAGEKESK